MTEYAPGRQRKRKRLGLALTAGLGILAVLIVPPLVSVGRFKSRITKLMATSLNRPVRLSSVNLRLLPKPGFELTDLTVEEDPAYGAEPILHANTVTASFRLLSLWRGRLEIGAISVDEASLNLVRTEAGRWNLDSLFRTAAAHAGPAVSGAGRRGAPPLPYLEATNSRINIKSGAEKLPFSLLSTDLSFWQQEPGVWRIRLRGQPARTDLSLDPADTGVVRLEATVRRAPELRQMPMHLDLDWRDAQLGQLTRLLIGSDPGWRGDLTGELHLDGTPDAAQVKTRLRAAGVHRAEFAPVAPLDFDARCAFVYHYSSRAFDDLSCDSPLGDGRIHFAGDLPGAGGRPHFSFELDRIPVAVGLDALRTVRSGFGPGLIADGAVSGKIAYSERDPEAGARQVPALKAKPGKSLAAKAHSAVEGPFKGSFTVDSFQLSGDALSTPIHFSRVVLEPVAASSSAQQVHDWPGLLAATVAIPVGGAGPLTVVSRLGLSGYRLTIHGQASLARVRQMAHVAGLPVATMLDSLAGGPVSMDLSAEGPWLPALRIPFSNPPPVGPANEPPSAAAAKEDTGPVSDRLSGIVTFRNSNWKADFLANHVEISTAALHLDNGEARWDPVVFAYGPVKGTARLNLRARCDAVQPCPPQFEVDFGDLDAGTLQAAILGARERGTLLSELIDRIRPSTALVWPQLEGAVKADSLTLGPVTLREPAASLRISPTGAEIAGLDAGLLGGRVHAAGTLSTGDKPSYSLQGQFQKLSPAAVGELLGLRWSGGAFDADGQIDLSGYTDKDLAASAKGTLHFEWRHGAVGAPAASSAAAPAPPALARFDRWTADAEIANGAITLKQNEVRQGARKRAVEAVVTLEAPPRVTFALPKETPAKKR
jgi:hypothetical protein